MQPEQCVNCGNTADKHILTSSDCGDDIGTMHSPTTATTVDLTDPAFTRLIYNPGAY